jgi:DNA-binding SARP family transcriptional activator/tetratricopeptide (TPR) repeat protein
VKFLILGPLSVTHEDRPVVLTGRRQRTALAVLLANAGRVVPLEYLIDAVWDDAPPATARRQIQNDISALRRALSGDGVRPGCIVADGHGYRIDTRPGELDAEVFQALVTEALELTQRAEPGPAAAALRSALRQWRGPALTGLSGRAVEAAAVRLEEQRLAALEQCLDLELHLGRQRELVSEIAELVAAHPLRERLVGQLMLALHGSGRQSEALAAYHRLRSRLGDELGLSPGTDLQRLHAAILRNEPAVGPLTEPPAAVPAVPAQLPADVPGFTGRADHLRTLDRLLPDGDRQAAHAVAVAGLAGVGKTALVVHWGHRVRDRFPDGQLYLDLRGYTADAPVRPEEALAHLLRSLGEPAEQLPADVQTAAGRYRSLLADRRVLVVLDNAASADQVRPLMPASPGSVVLVTSRDRLTGLVAREGADSLILDVLAPDEAHHLLAAILGPQRVAAEPAAAADLAGLCSRLPLALRVAAANLTGRPWSTIAELVAALRDGDRLAALDVDDDEQTGVRRAFDLSYQTLHPDTQRIFRLIGGVPGPDVTAGAVAALAATGAADARRQLDRLAAAHLINHHEPGRYRCHDLLRHYAAGRALAEDAEADRDAARQRLLGWYLHGAGRAADLLYPHPLRLPVPAPEVAVPAEMADATAALAWLDAEHGNLNAAIRHAAEHGPRSGAWLLADTLRGYFWLRMHTTDWRDAADGALTAARREGDLRAQASALLSLGDLHLRQGRPEPAVERYAAALALAERTGWRECEAAAISNLGVLYRDSGRLPQAVAHLRRGVALARTNGSRYGEAVALDALGRTYWHLGRLAEASECCAQALAINRAIGSRLGEAAALSDLGEIAHAQCNYPTAVDRLTRALDLFREVGDRTNQAQALRALAAARCERGDTGRAEELGHAALVRARELGDRRIEADALNTLGAIAHRTGRHAEAVGYHERALTLTRSSGDHYPETEALLGLSVAYQRLGQRDRALEHTERAAAIAEQLRYGLLERRALGILGRFPLVVAGPAGGTASWLGAV